MKTDWPPVHSPQGMVPMPAHKRSRLLNRFRFLLGRGHTAANVLDAVCLSHPDSEVLHVEAPLSWTGIESTVFTPRMLLDLVNRLGNVMLADGMQRYDRVGIWKANEVDYFIVAMAVIKAGGIAVPINAGMPTASLLPYLQTMGVSWLVTDPAGAAAMQAHREALPRIRRLWVTGPQAAYDGPLTDLSQAIAQASHSLAPVSLARDTPVFIVHTSGTTGFPKGVISTSGGIIAGIKGHFLSEPIRRSNRIGVAAHYNHIVTMLGLFTSLVGNMPTYCMQPRQPAAILRRIAQSRINIFFGFPDVFLNLLSEGLEGHDLDSVKVWISTADASHEAHMAAFVRHGAALRILGMRILRSVFIEPLGTSEVGFAAVQRIFFPFTKPRYRRMIGRRNWAGPNVKVADDEGKKLPRGRKGRLMVKGPTVFKGYWNAHDRSLDEFRDGWWYTGDEVYRDFWGRIYHMDRRVDIIETPGGPVYCTLSEERILAHPAVLEVAIIGVKNADQVELPIAVVALKPGKEVAADALMDWIQENAGMAHAVVQLHFVAHADIPRGLTGKVLRRTLRERYAHCLLPVQ